jgi:hypothetical protein
LRDRSGVLLAVDFGVAIPVQSPEAGNAGFGFDGRFGGRLALGPVWLAPQVTIGLVDFPAWEFAFRAGAGGQIGFEIGFVEPSAYLFGGGFLNFWKSGSGLRAGGAVDFRIGRRFFLGPHVDYDAASWDTGSLRYASVGVHTGWVINPLAPARPR